MPIFTAIGGAFENSGGTDGLFQVFNSAYMCTVGDNDNFIIGGARINNIFGADLKMVFDWEEMVMQCLPESFAECKLFSAFVGIGAEADLVFGDRSHFTYYGQFFECHRATEKTLKYVSPQLDPNVVAGGALEGLIDEDTQMVLKTAGIIDLEEVCMPLATRCCLYLGCLALVLYALVLRYYSGGNGLYNSTNQIDG
ncbi:MAG: hypothetical protein DWH82_10950 [Planctomycetota bacterium]|nr:MAG: hypothetical protein DWH82_10950 [Planctomycetota bacterium]